MADDQLLNIATETDETMHANTSQLLMQHDRILLGTFYAEYRFSSKKLFLSLYIQYSNTPFSDGISGVAWVFF